MRTITLKNVPAAVHQTMKARAKAHGRSLNKEIIATIEGTLHGVPIDAMAISGRARAVREAMGVYLTAGDLAKLKNVGRR